MSGIIDFIEADRRYDGLQSGDDCMGKIFEFKKTVSMDGRDATVSASIQDCSDEPDVNAMDRSQLEQYMEQLEEELEKLDDQEPQNEESEEYEQWADAHEELEDLIDEVQDRLDDLDD